MPCATSLGKSIGIDQLEFQLGCFTQQRLERLRIFQTGNLDDDTRIALTDNGRLPRAERVDTAAHDFGGAFHRAFNGLVQTLFGLGQHHAVAIDDFQPPFGNKPGTIDQIAEFFASTVNIGWIFQHERKLVIKRGKIADLDARLRIGEQIAD